MKQRKKETGESKSSKISYDSQSSVDNSLHLTMSPTMKSPVEKRDVISSKKSSKSKRAAKKAKKKNNTPHPETYQLSLDYLKKWKNDRSTWKFEKAKQIRLISNIFNQERIPQEFFEIFLEYMEQASDNVKKLLAERANEVISEVEKYDSLSEEEKLKTTKPDKYQGYKRARTLLQHFD